jgi:hypothetical protein
MNILDNEADWSEIELLVPDYEKTGYLHQKYSDYGDPTIEGQ